MSQLPEQGASPLGRLPVEQGEQIQEAAIEKLADALAVVHYLLEETPAPRTALGMAQQLILLSSQHQRPAGALAADLAEALDILRSLLQAVEEEIDNLTGGTVDG